MKKLFSFILFIASSITVLAQNDLDNNVIDYISQYKELAMAEQRRAGVPAAITLAQGIHESASGRSELAVDGNNHFGIKCKKTWTGQTILHDDDRRQECFRKYTSSDESYIDHSNFLRKNKRYAQLFSLEKTDYISWSQGLRKAGYATNPKYATRLIDLIEKYNLQEYTYKAMQAVKQPEIIAKVEEVIPKKDKVVASPIIKKKRNYYNTTTYKGLPGFYAKKGDYLLKQAMENDMRLAKLFNINDLDNTELYDDMFIYLKKKNKKGTRKYHIVEEGESMHSISQKEAIQLKYLYIYNNLYDTDEPAVGEKLYLQEKSLSTPRLRGEEIIAKKEKAKEIKQQSNTAPIKVSKSEKIQFIAEPGDVPGVKKKAKVERESFAQKDLARINKELAIAKEKKEQAIAKEKAEAAKAAELKSKKVEVITQKADESRWIKKSTTGNKGTKFITSNPNIIDITKAKRVERLLDNGHSEIDITVVPIEEETTEKVEENKKNDLKSAEKAAQEAGEKVKEEKREVTEKTVEVKEEIKKKVKPAPKKEKKREYNEKNVGDDVKDLKKKFDSIIYSGDE